MTVRINKPALNLREKLAELDKPSGIVGEQILRSDTAEDAREALNLEEHLFEDFESTGVQDNATSTKVTVSDSGVDVTGTVTADGLTVSGTENLCATLESTHVGGNARLFFINEGNAQEFNIGYNNNGEFTLYNANTSNTPLKVFPNGEINIPNGIHTTNITPTVGGLLNVEKSGANVLIRTIADEPNIAGLDIGTPSDPDKHRIRSLADSDDLHIVVNNLERMRFRNNRVGINTADPQQLLDVGGRGLFRSHLEVGLDTGGVGLTTNDGGGNASVTFNHTAQIPDQDGNVGRIRVNTDETTNALMEFQIGTNKTNGVSSPIPSRYVISANAHIWNKSEDNATEAMRLDSSGNLLVGTTDSTLWNNGAGGNTGVLISGSLGNIQVARSGSSTIDLNRLDSDGEIAIFRKDGSKVGSIGVSGNRPYFSTNETGFRVVGSGVRPTNGTGIDSDAGADLGASSVRWKDLYLSGGVYLGGTGSANKLDDYEEGTWTPTMQASGQTVTYSEQFGRYVKIGDMVHVQGRITITSVSGGSGALIFGSLPFTSDSGSYYNSTLNVTRVANFNADYASSMQSIMIIQGTNYGYLYRSPNLTGNSSTFGSSDIKGGSTIVFSGTYKV